VVGAGLRLVLLVGEEPPQAVMQMTNAAVAIGARMTDTTNLGQPGYVARAAANARLLYPNMNDRGAKSLPLR
jgi:hypothetical protein